MIQSARSSDSRSLLREAESAILLIEELNIKSWFEKAIEKMIDKRNDPEAVFTGAKELKTNLLAYLSQNGELATANVWCRKIIYSEIREFLRELEEHMQNKGFVGVLELHLQDREINSPHIQYVGTNAELAEKEIANFIVKKGYEDSLESAINSNHTPDYLTQDAKNLRIKKTDDELEQQEKYQEQQKYIEEIKSNIKEGLAKISSLRSEFLEIFKDNFKLNVRERREKKEVKLEQREKNTQDALKEWEEKAKVRKNRR